MNVCRLCLEIGENFNAIDDANRRQIDIFLPEVAIDSVECSVLCSSCASALRDMYEFRLKCLRTETTIEKFIKTNGLVDLKNIIDDLRKPLKDCVEFAQCGAEGDVKVNDLHSAVEIKQEIHDEPTKTLEERHVCYVCNDTFPFAIIKSHMKTHATCLRCNECNKSMSLEHHYRKHLLSHKTDTTICEKPFTQDDEDEEMVKQWVTVKCKDCDKMFHSKYNLEKHLASHKRDCETCGKQFSSHTHLRVHLADVHGCTDETGRHKCKHCESVFYTESALVKHGITHSIKAGYVCHVCGKELSTPKQLQNHGQVHVKVQCSRCNMTVRKSSLEDHLRTHTGEKPFKCEKCGKGFTQSGSLYTHLRDMHNSIKRFACDVCDVKFKYRRSFHLHMENHSGNVEKPHVCDVCGKAFRVGTGLKKHKLRHTNDKPYVCFVCGVGFVDSSGLKRHTSTHTGEKPYQCNVCEFRCNRKSNLRVHVKSHLRKTRLKNDGVDKYCWLCKSIGCDVAFVDLSSLKLHANVHTAEKPYQCDVCEFRFNRKSNLRVHLKSHLRKMKNE